MLALFASFFLSLPFAGRVYLAPTAADLYPSPETTARTLVESPPGEIRILTYNVFLRPRPISSKDYTAARARHIAQWIKEANVDIVALQEAWEPGAVSLLLGELVHDFPYYVIDQPARRSIKAVSGGLLVLSRWPIETTQTVVYDDCHLADCLAAKGALHVLVRLSKNARLNVVVTHLDAGAASRDREVRVSQLEQLAQLIDSIDQRAGPLLLAGDFNINSLAADGQFDMLTTSLDVETGTIGNPSTVNCELESSIFCEEPVSAQQIDYLFTRC